MADGVDVFDTWNFAQQLLHGKTDALRHLFRRCARHLYEHIQHGDDDLRFFLARSLKDAESTEKQCSYDYQWRQLRVDEAVSDASRQAQTLRGLVRCVESFFCH